MNIEELPSKDLFYNELREISIQEKYYFRAQQVRETFSCETLREYSDIYLKSHVLLLSDIFENFRNTYLKTYQLDPATFYTLPGLSWSAFLKYTEVEIQLLSDIDMIHFISNSIRGGICQASIRSATANNPFLHYFNPNEPSSYIMYLDATNLYGATISEFLPISNFKWSSDDEINQINLMDVADNNEYGYIFEVDLDYPEQLHNFHNDLPLCPESITAPISSKEKEKINTEFI